METLFLWILSMSGESFLIWVWVLIGVAFSISALIVKFANPKKRLDGLSFFAQMIAMILLSYVAKEISDIPNDTLLYVFVGWALELAAFVYSTLIIVYRLQDINWNKWLICLGLIPFLNIIFVLVLIFKTSHVGLVRPKRNTSNREPLPIPDPK